MVTYSLSGNLYFSPTNIPDQSVGRTLQAALVPLWLTAACTSLFSCLCLQVAARPHVREEQEVGAEVDHCLHLHHLRCSVCVLEIESGSVVAYDHESLNVIFAFCHEIEIWRNDAYVHEIYAVCHENAIVSSHKSGNEIAFFHENDVYDLLSQIDVFFFLYS